MTLPSSILAYLLVISCWENSNAFSLWKSEASTNASDYGVDISFPIHHYIDKNRSPQGFQRYADMINGCYEKFSRRECDATERARIDMNLNQPKSEHNYTEIGFKKLRVPAAAWEPLLAFYEANKDQENLENWPRGNTYVNNWDSPTYMISLENRALRGGLNVKKQVWDGVKPIIEEWTGHKLEPTSLYGIRVYKEGAMLSTHVDRLPLVSSCIIQVAQDIDEPWPIEVYDHAGKAYNVTMQPGDMVLYESHTVLHGRPFPMKGRRYANVFVHFQPVDHEAMNELDREAKRHPAAPAVASRKTNKVDSVGSALKGLFGSSDSAKKPAPVVANKKAHIGGHEQSNHDEDHVQEHLDRIDKENEAREAAVKAADAAKADQLDAKSRMMLAKSAAQLDDRAASIKATLLAAKAKLAAEQGEDVNDPDSADHLPVKRPAMKARNSDPVRPPEHVRFNRHFAAVDSKSASGEAGASGDKADGVNSPDAADASQEEPGSEESGETATEDEGMAEAANAIADMVDPANKELVEALRDAAANGDHKALVKLLDDQNVHLIHTKDENDWNILHEAIRSGDLDTVRLLVDLGADIGAKVLSGGAALWIAKYYLEEDHPITQYLIDIGAPEDEEL